MAIPFIRRVAPAAPDSRRRHREILKNDVSRVMLGRRSGLAQKKRKAALRTSAINQSISHGRGIGYYALAGGGPEALAR
jgi:hypothetical protein